MEQEWQMLGDELLVWEQCWNMKFRDNSKTCDKLSNFFEQHGDALTRSNLFQRIAHFVRDNIRKCADENFSAFSSHFQRIRMRNDYFLPSHLTFTRYTCARLFSGLGAAWRPTGHSSVVDWLWWSTNYMWIRYFVFDDLLCKLQKGF